MSGSNSDASVANDAEVRSYNKSDDKEDLLSSLNRVELEDSSNRAEGPVRLPGFVSSPPRVQEEVGPFVPRFGPLQDGDPALLQHSTNVS